MERMIKHITLLLSLMGASIFTACDKDTQLPAREVSPEVAKIAKNYTDILVESQQGWVLAYKPDQSEETIYFHLTFKDREKVDVVSGYRGYHTLQADIPYYYEGNYTPVVVFSGENVFSELASSLNGAYKFKIYYREEQGTFELVRSDGFDDKRFELIRANDANLALLQTQIDEVLAEIAYEEEQIRLTAEVRQKIKDFVEIESDFYFYNLTVEDFSAAINSFDTVTREISLTYKETPTSAPTTATVNYEIQPQGILLTPAFEYGSVSIDLIELGELKYEDPDDTNKATALEIVSAGNAGAGSMGYAHVAPYPYTRSTDRSQTLVDYFMTDFPSNVETRESSPTAISPIAEVYSHNLRDYIRGLSDPADNGRHLIGLYSPNNATTGIRNLLWIGYTTSGGSGAGFNIRIDYINLGENRLNMNRVIEQTTVTAVRPDITAQAQEFLDKVAPSQGVTLVPFDTGAGYRLRVVSTVDSRIWIEYRWLNATYWNMVFN